MKRIAIALVTLAAVACAKKNSEEPKAAEAHDAAGGAAEIDAFGFDRSGMKPSVEPGDDFDAYANGGWKERFEIPPDLDRYGAFKKLRLEAEEDIRDIVESLAAKEVAEGSLEAKVGKAYAAYMDVKAINARGAEVLQPKLADYAALESRKQVFAAFATLHNTAPYGIGVIPDPADTTRYAAFVAQDGLGMPDRDYYLEDDERMVGYRSAYRAFVEKMLTLAGIEDAAARAERIIDFETELAEVHWSRAESRQIKKIYNPMTTEQLVELAPDYGWPNIFAQLGLEGVETFIVAQPSAIEKAAKLIGETEIDTLKDYLAFHYIRNHAEFLSEPFVTASFEFYRKRLKGVGEQRARWKRAIEFINGGMGEAVGKVYVERHFPPEAKTQMDALVSNLQAALQARIKANQWMDEETKTEALAKLSTFEPRIGYTTKWTDYAPLTITDDAFANAREVREFQWSEQVERLGGPVDRERWPYPPQTVNASYNPLLNQITFPAGILQPPFFDPDADPAVNYGAIGAVIGHEIGHGFDDQGRRFDEKGLIRDWWTKEADTAYTALTTQLGAQFGEYEPVKGMKINPELTMGENIGDLGGLQMAYAAYQRHLDECCNGEAPVIDGLTGDQRFFLGWAQIWRALYRDDALREQVLTDPHSNPRFRINGIVRNMDPWYAAFDVKPDDELYLPPDERVVIW